MNKIKVGDIWLCCTCCTGDPSESQCENSDFEEMMVLQVNGSYIRHDEGWQHINQWKKMAKVKVAKRGGLFGLTKRFNVYEQEEGSANPGIS